jgi:hypothetical protein
MGLPSLLLLAQEDAFSNAARLAARVSFCGSFDEWAALPRFIRRAAEAPYSFCLDRERCGEEHRYPHYLPLQLRLSVDNRKLCGISQ